MTRPFAIGFLLFTQFIFLSCASRQPYMVFQIETLENLTADKMPAASGTITLKLQKCQKQVYCGQMSLLTPMFEIGDSVVVYGYNGRKRMDFLEIDFVSSDAQFYVYRNTWGYFRNDENHEIRWFETCGVHKSVLTVY